MASTPRERLLLALLPTIVLTLVWVVGLRGGHAKNFAAAQDALMKARPMAPPDEVLADLRSKKNAAAEKDAAETKRRQALLERWNSLRKRLEPAEQPTTVVQQLAELFEHHELTILSHERSDNGELPKSFAGLSEKLRTVQEWEKTAAAPIDPRAMPQPGSQPAAAAPTPAAAPAGATEVRRLSLWRMELSGKYSDMQSALAEVAERLPQVATVQVVMAEVKPNLSLRHWTVWLAL